MEKGDTLRNVSPFLTVGRYHTGGFVLKNRPEGGQTNHIRQYFYLKEGQQIVHVLTAKKPE